MAPVLLKIDRNRIPPKGESLKDESLSCSHD
jgi:hypothetical protein